MAETWATWNTETFELGENPGDSDLTSAQGRLKNGEGSTNVAETLSTGKSKWKEYCWLWLDVENLCLDNDLDNRDDAQLDWTEWRRRYKEVRIHTQMTLHRTLLRRALWLIDYGGWREEVPKRVPWLWSVWLAVGGVSHGSCVIGSGCWETEYRWVLKGLGALFQLHIYPRLLEFVQTEEILPCSWPSVNKDDYHQKPM